MKQIKGKRYHRLSQEVYPLLTLLLLLTLFFYRILFRGKIFFFGDLKFGWYPWMDKYGESLKNLEIFFWTPLSGCGFPILAEGQIGAFYPFNMILYFFLPTIHALNLNIILHLLLAGNFMYMFARRIELERFPALISSIIFTFSGSLIANIQRPPALYVISWLPLIFYFIKTYFATSAMKYPLLIGIVLALQCLAGYPQYTYYSLMAWSLYFLSEAISNYRAKKTIGRIFSYSRDYIIAISIALGLYAIQLLSTLELIRGSVRGGGVTQALIEEGSFSPLWFIKFIIPFFYLGYSPLFSGWSEWEANLFQDVVPYLGCLPIILSALTLFEEKNRTVKFFLFLLIFSFLFMLGKYTPFYSLIGIFPGILYFRAPARFVFIAIFSLSVLSGYGFTILSNSRTQRSQLSKGVKIICITALGIYFIFLVNSLFFHLINTNDLESGLSPYFPTYNLKAAFLLLKNASITQPHIYLPLLFFTSSTLLVYWRENKRLSPLLFQIASFGLVTADLFLFSLALNPVTEYLDLIRTPPVVNILKKDPSLYRIFTPAVLKIYPHKKPEWTLPPDYNMIQGIASIRTIFPLKLKRYDKILIAIGGGDFGQGAPLPVEPHILYPNLLNLLNAKYILSFDKLNYSNFRLIYNKEVNLYENIKVLPRAFIVPQAKIIKEEEKILEELKSQEFDPSSFVILEEKPAEASGNLNATNPWDYEGMVRITEYKPRKVELYAQLKRDGYLILSDIYYPGWKAYVNGVEQKIYRADYILRALYLKRGSHEIKFVYEPFSYKIGLYISGLTVIGLTSISILFVYRKLFP